MVQTVSHVSWGSESKAGIDKDGATFNLNVCLKRLQYLFFFITVIIDHNIADIDSSHEGH